MSQAHLLAVAHHDGSGLFVEPGERALGDVVQVRVRVPSSHAVRGVHLRTVRDGEPRLVPARLERSDDDERWFVAELTLHNPTTPYRFLLDEPGGYRWLTGTGLHAREVTDASDFRITVHPSAPDWARHSVVYQVFPDRFARSRPLVDVPSWAEPAEWNDEPAAVGRSTSRQLYGGDLAGIEEHLDHLERLGADVLYLTPFFPSRSCHRYDATTFDHVDPLLGGDEALASLSRAVHSRGMRIMGDLTTNHTGVGHEWFDRARTDPSSEEASFYHWTDAEPGYASWLDHPSLPTLDHTEPALAARLVDGPGSVVDRWLREPYCLDGWRIDVANMTGRYGAVDVTASVARTIRATLTRTNPDALLISEHFHDATADLRGDGWHGNMNYAGFARPVWGWLTPEGSEARAPGLPVPAARREAAAMVAAMREVMAAVPWSVTAHQWNLLGSHDTPRIRTIVGPDMVEVAVGLLMTYPGTPMVFSGDEIGATGTTGEHSRVTMPWDEPGRWDAAAFETYRSLIAVRRASRALRDGGLRWAVVDPDAVVYLRETPDERVLVAVARGPWQGTVLPAALAPSGSVDRLHGPDLLLDHTGLHVPGAGPSVGIWRLA